MNSDELRDKKLKEFFKKDQVISKSANKVFDNFINEINNSEHKNDMSKVKYYSFRKILTVAASLMIIFVGSNAYATHLGYENIFFMIKELYQEKNITDKAEIFSDRDIIISYQSFYITDGIEMQVNELQIKDNETKLYLFVKEEEDAVLTPFIYKVYNENGELMCEEKSRKKSGALQYSEILDLENYIEDMRKIDIEIYSKQQKLLKTITVDLDSRILEAKSEEQEVKQISQITLNKFLKEQTEKYCLNKDIKNQQVLILKLIDIAYSDSIYIVKYIYCLPTKEDLSNGNVENLDMYVNTVKFILNSDDEYEIVDFDKPENVEL